MKSKSSLVFACSVGLIAVCLMVVFLATGAASPEPGDHPAWMPAVMGTLPGHILYLIVTFLCLPAFIVASFVASWDPLFWGIACFVQFVLYFSAGFILSEAIRWLVRQ